MDITQRVIGPEFVLRFLNFDITIKLVPHYIMVPGFVSTVLPVLHC